MKESKMKKRAEAHQNSAFDSLDDTHMKCVVPEPVLANMFKQIYTVQRL